jgi:hypothetical protein
MSVLLTLILIAAGAIAVVVYVQYEAAANASGYIIGCNGTVDIQYHYLHNASTVWYYGVAPLPGFCAVDCCNSYITSNITVYFVIGNGTARVLDSEKDLLTVGCSLFVCAVLSGAVAFITWRHTTRYQAVN